MMSLKIDKISEKQLSVLTWWCNSSKNGRYDAIICDGAVRSGKTLFMGLSFVIWAMESFSGKKLGMCGKTIGSMRRNVTSVILPLIKGLGFTYKEKLSENIITVKYGERENSFYLFGGRDESSASLIQGITFAGVLFDEVALQPESFVSQACARCSVEGSKFWFNCNPEGPNHWFYKSWIQKCRERSTLYIHFTMDDNPSLSDNMKERYKKMYSGSFYRRFILGEWVVADGRVYDFFDDSFVCSDIPKEFSEYCISCDYGTRNPTSFGLWGENCGVWYRIKEYYYNSRESGRQKTDEEYVSELKALAEGREIRKVVVDPSALSFIEALSREGFCVIRAKNNVLSGIRLTATLLKNRRLVISDRCKDAIREFYEYVWEKDRDTDAPKKENDHAMDEIRYFASTIAEQRESPFAAAYVER